MSISEILKIIVVAIVVSAIISLVALYVGSLPTVTFSYSTGECVRVDDPRMVYSCENLPPSYTHVWGE